MRPAHFIGPALSIFCATISLVWLPSSTAFVGRTMFGGCGTGRMAVAGDVGLFGPLLIGIAWMGVRLAAEYGIGYKAARFSAYVASAVYLVCAAFLFSEPIWFSR